MYSRQLTKQTIWPLWLGHILALHSPQLNNHKPKPWSLSSSMSGLQTPRAAAAAAPSIGGLELLHLWRHWHIWTLWRLQPTWRRARAWRLSPNMSEYYRRSRARTRRAWGRRYGERWASSAFIYRSDGDVMVLLSDGSKAGLCLLKMQLGRTLCHCWWIYQIKCWSSRCELMFFQMNSLNERCILYWHCNVIVISNTQSTTQIAAFLSFIVYDSRYVCIIC